LLIHIKPCNLLSYKAFEVLPSAVYSLSFPHYSPGCEHYPCNYQGCKAQRNVSVEYCFGLFVNSIGISECINHAAHHVCKNWNSSTQKNGESRANNNQYIICLISITEQLLQSNFFWLCVWTLFLSFWFHRCFDFSFSKIDNSAKM
jgi:hypothetical protein